MQTPRSSLNALNDRFGFQSIPPDWPAQWERAAASQPDPLPFLDDHAIQEAADFCALSTEIRDALGSAAAQARNDPLLVQTAWFLHHLYFADPPPTPADIWAWPFVSQFAHGPAALIPALVLLAGVPRLRARHAQRAIPSEITRATLTDLEIWIRDYRQQHGEWGLSNLPWLSHGLAGRLFRLGRLQFIHKPFAGPVHAFRHKTTGQVVALSGPEVRIRSDGFVDGTNDEFDPQAYQPQISRTATAVTGHPIHPLGWVRPTPITLSFAEWAPALAPGDPILDIHIPAAGPMAFELCGESIRQALDFFPRHFPEAAPAVAFHCSTWFFDFQFQKILPPTSNIVRMQREFYLFPLFSYDREAFRRAFGTPPTDLTTAPRDTHLRRAILDFTLAGHRLRCAGGFLPVRDLVWGSARYQTSIPEILQ